MFLTNLAVVILLQASRLPYTRNIYACRLSVLFRKNTDGHGAEATLTALETYHSRIYTRAPTTNQSETRRGEHTRVRVQTSVRYLSGSRTLFTPRGGTAISEPTSLTETRRYGFPRIRVTRVCIRLPVKKNHRWENEQLFSGYLFTPCPRLLP